MSYARTPLLVGLLVLCCASSGVVAAASPMGRKLASVSPPPPSPAKMCLCDNTLIEWVCGSDNLSYESPCEADCAGVVRCA